MDAQTLNNQLHRLYTDHWNALMQNLPKRSGYSYPLFMNANAAYASAPVRLLIVGQQPFYWGCTEYGDWGQRELDAPVEQLMKLYRTFNRGEKYKLTPFWDATYQLQSLLNPGSDRYGMMWSNLVRLDCDKKCPQPDVEEAVSTIPLLAEEIAITRPEVVIFFTGPDYDERLKATFKGVRMKPVLGFTSRMLAIIEHPTLPPNSFRTYHPGYLKRQGQISPIVNKIAQLVQADSP